MGVHGLTRYIRQNETSCSRPYDLVQEARTSPVLLLVDFYGFGFFILRRLWNPVPDLFISRTEFGKLDNIVRNWIRILNEVGIRLSFYADGSTGSDLQQFNYKREEAKSRSIERLNKIQRISNYCSGYINTIDLNEIILPPFFYSQLRISILNAGAEIINCNCGEADGYLARDRITRSAFAVLSGDSDFAIMRDSRLILFDTFDMQSQLPIHNASPTSKITSLNVLVFEPSKLAQSLSINESLLPDLAFLCGCDYSSHLLKKYGIHWNITLIVDKFRRIKNYRGIEHLMEFSHVKSNDDFLNALKFTRNFYTNYYIPQYPTTYLANEVARDAMPKVVLAVEASQIWSISCSFDDISSTDTPGVEICMRPLRRAIYTLLQPPSRKVTEIGRTHNQPFGEVVVNANLKDLEKVNLANVRTDPQLKLKIFWQCLTHIDVSIIRQNPSYIDVALLIILTLPSTQLSIHELDSLMLTLLICRSYYSGQQHSSPPTQDGIAQWPIEFQNFIRKGGLCILTKELQDIIAFVMEGASTLPSSYLPTFRTLVIGQTFSSILEYVFTLSSIVGMDSRVEPKLFYDGLLLAHLESKNHHFMKIRSMLLENVEIKNWRIRLLVNLPAKIQTGYIDTSIKQSRTFTTPPPSADRPPNIKLNPKAKPYVPPNLRTDNKHDEPPPSSSKLVKTTNGQSLPIEEKKGEILNALSTNRVVFVRGETGCGKSTQVPQYLLDNNTNANIIVTQPRRVAAISLARRVAAERGSRLGDEIGYRIRGDRKDSGKNTKITFVTTGYLLQVLINNPRYIEHHSHIVLDEVHERGIDSDLLSLIIRITMMNSLQESKLILMSATLQGAMFADYFQILNNGPPIEIYVGNRMFPVETIYLEDLIDKTNPNITTSVNRRLDQLKTAKEGQGVITTQVSDLMYKLALEVIFKVSKPGCSTLVFLPGMGEITDMYDTICFIEQDNRFPKYKIFPLHSEIPREQQDEVFTMPKDDTVHIILATNIAESSLTLPRVNCVVDFGLCRRLEYDTRRGLASLMVSWISQACVTQRSGRAGREMPGKCICLYPAWVVSKCMPLFTPPEMESSPLTKLYLHAKILSLRMNYTPKEILSMVIQPPNIVTLSNAIEELINVGALDNSGQGLTLFGMLCLRLPLDLSACQIVYMSILLGCPCDGAFLSACVSCDDPFTKPFKFYNSSAQEYFISLRESVRSRCMFDGGYISEPIMGRNLIVEWLLCSFDNNHGTLFHFTREFCEDVGGVVFRRFNRLLYTAIDVMDKVSTLVDPSQSKAVALCIQCLRGNPPKDMDHRVFMSSILCNDLKRLRCLLAVSNCPKLMLGTAATPPQKVKEDVPRSISFAIENVGKEDVEKLIKRLCGDNSIKEIEYKANKVKVVFNDFRPRRMPPRSASLGQSDLGFENIDHYVNLVFQYQSQNKIKMEKDKTGESTEAEEVPSTPTTPNSFNSTLSNSLIPIGPPNHGFRVTWKSLYQNVPNKKIRTYMRNPIGCLCTCPQTNDKLKYVVATCSSMTMTDWCLSAEGVTVLPTAIACTMIMIFMPSGVRPFLCGPPWNVRSLIILDKELTCFDNLISLEKVYKINQLRSLFSNSYHVLQDRQILDTSDIQIQRNDQILKLLSECLEESNDSIQYNDRHCAVTLDLEPNSSEVWPQYIIPDDLGE